MITKINGRNIDEAATVTLTLSEWNLLICAMFDARQAMIDRKFPSLAESYYELQQLIEAGGLNDRIRKAYLTDFPFLEYQVVETDEALERKTKRDRIESLTDLVTLMDDRAALLAGRINKSDPVELVGLDPPNIDDEIRF